MRDDPQVAGKLSAELNALLEELFAKSPGLSFGLTLAQFKIVLGEIATKHISVDAQETAGTLRDFFSSLRIDDLVLARACAAGNDRAWESFLSRFREKLYDIAGYVAKDSAAARELADSTYADLYGTKLRDGHRVSKLASYTGRGSLEGWLRTVIAQEYVNQYRRRRRLVSFEEEAEVGTQFPAPPVTTETETPVDARLEAATDEALAALPPEDLFVLTSYYLEDKTLAEIARALSVHESTISRKVDKLLKSLRKKIFRRIKPPRHEPPPSRRGA